MNFPDRRRPRLRVRDLHVEIPLSARRKVHAVSGVSLEVAEGETLGLVGESGCGKSSLARAVMQIPPPTAGRVLLDDIDLTGLRGSELRALRGRFQMVFQDPLASLNPVKSVGENIALPLRAAGMGSVAARSSVEKVMADVGLDPAQYFSRRPARLSGGQCQRACIARALVLEPGLLVCDEPVSALDVSVQAQIINLLHDLKESRGLSLLFISHDLAVVRNIADRVAVMYMGRLCETAPADVYFRASAHPYSRTLLAAVPRPDPLRPGGIAVMTGSELPSAVDPPSGCRFRTRCPRAQRVCAEEIPLFRESGPDHFLACHFPVRDGDYPWGA